MALNKTITDPRSGRTAQYWRVESIEISPRERIVRITMAGYTAEEYRRQAQGVPVEFRTWAFVGADYDTVTAPFFAGVAGALYATIKSYRHVGQQPGEAPEFANAADA